MARDNYGYTPNIEGGWHPQVNVSAFGIGMVPEGVFTPDPYLPALVADKYLPSKGVVIPRGRVVAYGNASSVNGAAAYRLGPTKTGDTPITLHNGQHTNPAGMSVNQIMQYSADNQWGTDENVVMFRKGFQAEVVYNASINDAHGPLYSGKRFTGYYGTTDAESVSDFRHVGKPCLWVPMRAYHVNASASAIVNLTAAVYPGIRPVITMARNGSAFVAASASALTYSAAAGNWVASFSGAVTNVDYSYGQDADQIAGEVVRIRPWSDILDNVDFQKYVSFANNSPLDFGPAFGEYELTSVGSGVDPVTGSGWETPSTVTANIAYRVENYPMSPDSVVSVAIQGTFKDKNGNELTYSGAGAEDWYILPTNISTVQGYFQGDYHTINYRTGVITLSANIVSITGIKIKYSYFTDFANGAVKWGTGLRGLTDGSNVLVDGNQAYGLPGHLNVDASAAGSLRVIVY